VKYSFNKASRWGPSLGDKKHNFTTVAHSIFDKAPGTAGNKSLGGCGSRWGNRTITLTEQTPFGHLAPSTPDPAHSRNGRSFGTGRAQMNKLHIDLIKSEIEKGRSSPSPVAY
jgi:hypothetical protein